MPDQTIGHVTDPKTGRDLFIYRCIIYFSVHNDEVTGGKDQGPHEVYVLAPSQEAARDDLIRSHKEGSRIDILPALARDFDGEGVFYICNFDTPTVTVS